MAENNFTESNSLQKPLHLLWPFARRHGMQMGVALLAVGLAASTVLVFGWGLKNLVDKGFAAGNGAYLNQALLGLLGVILLLATASYMRFFSVWWIAERVTADLRKEIFSRLLSLDPGWFEGTKTGTEVSRINTDTTVLQMVMATNLPAALRHALTLAGGIVMLFVVSPGLTGLVMLVVPVVVVPVVWFGRRVRRRARDTQSRVGDIASYGHEALMGLQTIQSFVHESAAAAQFARLADDTFGAALKYIRMRSFLTAFVIAVVFSAIGAVLWAGGHRVLAGDMTAGSLSAFVFYAIMVAGSVAALAEAASAFSHAAGAADRISTVLSARPAQRGEKTLPRPVAGRVAFEGVGFSYPSRPGQKALDGVSFTAQAGKSVALVGPSGAGKSTVFQLLQKFYAPQEGRILVDGTDIAACDPRDLRRHMAVVAQDPAIFSVSVAENILIGRPGASAADLRRAAEQAQAHEFIEALPEGYATLVGERGSRLSGGQRQRIAIARAILKDAPLLLLDEATSALDSSSELAVHTALRNLMQGRTTLIIAHRLSTVQNAGHIVVLDKGRVVAGGTHAELYGSDGLYTHLAKLQLEAAG